MAKVKQALSSIGLHMHRLSVNLHIRRLASQVNTRPGPDQAVKPVVFFNATTRLVGVSLNAAYSLLTSWALRLQKVPIVHFVCQAGMSRCVLGTDRTDFSKPPPCRACIAQSRWLYSSAPSITFTYHQVSQLAEQLAGLSLSQLMEFESQVLPEPVGDKNAGSLPLGRLVLPSIRWVLRRHHLQDDDATRSLYREYMLSASHIAAEFSKFLEHTEPQAVILFNGQFFPEAVARWISRQHGIHTITHEVGLQPLTAFFTTGEATAYPLQVPDDFELTPEQDARLDAYLGARFQGQFDMAGIRFWPEMKGLDQAFMAKAASFRQIVPVFTNVIFDTSQPHSNVIFPHMFAWLDLVLELVRKNTDTLFVIRAHPDESRPGKSSQESVSQWVSQNKADVLTNLIFVDSDQPLSSYELIQRSKFVMVYNSTIGLEASLMGMPVLCAGRARFTQLPTVFFPASPQAFRLQAEYFLSSRTIFIPPEHKRNARRFLYYQLYRSSLPFTDFIAADQLPGFVRLKHFSLNQLTPEHSVTVKTLLDGILHGKSFLLEND